MPTTVNTTTITFNNGSTQNTAVQGTVTPRIYYGPGTWTKPSGLKRIKVIMVGNGGNSGSQPVATGVGCGGGGGGGSITAWIEAPSISVASVPVGVNVPGIQGPGTSTFGPWSPQASTLYAYGGADGSGATGGLGGNGAPFSTAGTNIWGTVLSTTGKDGAPAMPNRPGGNGGDSVLGGGGLGGVMNQPGNNGGNFGGGAGGAGGNNWNGVNPEPTSTKTATTGALGIVIIEEYY